MLSKGHGWKALEKLIIFHMGFILNTFLVAELCAIERAGVALEGVVDRLIARCTEHRDAIKVEL